MPAPQSHTIDWNQPLIPQVTRKLLDEAAGDRIDLSDLQVIVPTKQAGRRLREALALAASENNSALLPPEILTPDVLLAQATREEDLASDVEVLTAWGQVLDGIHLDRFRALLPSQMSKSTSWRLGLARRLVELRADLGEAGLDFADVSEAVKDTAFEPLRWKQLAKLEQAYLEQLASIEKCDPLRSRRAAARNFQPQAPIRKIILAATPDAQALPLAALESAAESVEVAVWVYGAPDEPELFDRWGRPMTELWTQRTMPLEQWGCHLQSTADTSQMAARTVDLVRPQPPEAVAIGTVDIQFAPAVANALKHQSIPSFNPEGEPLTQSDIGRLTDQICEFIEEPNTRVVRSLLQHPDIWNWLQSEHQSGPTQSKILQQLDQLFQEHLVPDLEGILYFAARKDVFQSIHRAALALDAILSPIKAAPDFTRSLARVLQQIYESQILTSEGKDSETRNERAQALRALIDQFVACEANFKQATPDWTRMAFRQQLARKRVYPERPREAHDLLGWLELLWNDAPHLILAGMNEGVVPESVVGDAFLPDSLRAELGLRTNARRFARDAYLLEALCRRRSNSRGRIDLLVPQRGNDQTPQKPSRLLFLSESDHLLARVRTLFEESTAQPESTRHAVPWTFVPPQLPRPTRLSVSALKSYLHCPFRFFLTYILGLRAVDCQMQEMSAAAFGNLFHDSVAELRGLQLSASKKADDLFKQLQQAAERKRFEQYGNRLSFALKLQEVALHARLKTFAHQQVEDVQLHGARLILETEKSFQLPINGIEICGRIDRIDQLSEGRLELIDYKTGDSPDTPVEAHLATVARKAPPAHLPEAAFFEHEGKRYRWTDLQLPLYALAEGAPDAERPALAYFNLSKTADKSGIARWGGFTESHRQSALACAEAVVEQIKKGVFWPPNPDAATQWDAIAPLFPEGIAQTVDQDAFENYRFAAVDTGATES